MRYVAGLVAGSLAAMTGLSALAADGLPGSLTGRAGDAAKGRQIVAARQVGLCLLCHSGPFREERFQGTIAPDLTGVGERLSEAELRLRLVDSGKVVEGSIMPAYFATGGLNRVGPAWQGKPILTAEQIEDVVAFLRTLRAER